MTTYGIIIIIIGMVVSAGDMQMISVCRLLYMHELCPTRMWVATRMCSIAIGLHLMWGLLLHAHSVYSSVEWNWSEQCNWLYILLLLSTAICMRMRIKTRTRTRGYNNFWTWEWKCTSWWWRWAKLSYGRGSSRKFNCRPMDYVSTWTYEVDGGGRHNVTWDQLEVN